MKFRVAITLGFVPALGAIAWPAEVLAVGYVVADTFRDAYLGRFLDKATFLVNCL